MKAAALKPATRDIVVDEVLPHAPEMIWKALTTGHLIGQWLMPPSGFEPIEGKRFTYQTKPAGGWDGVIHCQVLEVKPTERFAYTWKGGHDSNVGYGAPLHTVVTWTLSRVAGGTRVRLVHSGFVAPGNDAAFKGMSEGWKVIVGNLGTVIQAESGQSGSARL